MIAASERATGGTDMLAKEKWQIATIAVLENVFEERTRQVARYGHNEGLKDGTGPEVQWLPEDPDPASLIEKLFRRDYEEHEARHGAPTWMHLVREELAEAFAEDDPERLEEELTQVAALCVSWVEKLRRRAL
jgi:hypothetical protein